MFRRNYSEPIFSRREPRDRFRKLCEIINLTSIQSKRLTGGSIEAVGLSRYSRGSRVFGGATVRASVDQASESSTRVFGNCQTRSGFSLGKAWEGGESARVMDESHESPDVDHSVVTQARSKCEK